MPGIFPETVIFLSGIKLIPVNGGKFVQIVFLKRFICHCENNPQSIHDKIKELKNGR